MTSKNIVGVEGADELIATMRLIADDFSPQQANKFLVAAVRQSMKPVLARAKSLVPVDTGALRASLQVEARRPTSRDRRSKYVAPGDVVIASVTTASGKKLKTLRFKNVKTGERQVGVASDARAIAAEFGTSKKAAKPFLRPALESQAGIASQTLAVELKKQLDKYERKNR